MNFTTRKHWSETSKDFWCSLLFPWCPSAVLRHLCETRNHGSEPSPRFCLSNVPLLWVWKNGLRFSLGNTYHPNLLAGKLHIDQMSDGGAACPAPTTVAYIAAQLQTAKVLYWKNIGTRKHKALKQYGETFIDLSLTQVHKFHFKWWNDSSKMH